MSVLQDISNESAYNTGIVAVGHEPASVGVLAEGSDEHLHRSGLPEGSKLQPTELLTQGDEPRAAIVLPGDEYLFLQAIGAGGVDLRACAMYRGPHESEATAWDVRLGGTSYRCVAGRSGP